MSNWSQGTGAYTTQHSKGIYSTKYIIHGYVYQIKHFSIAIQPAR